MVIEYRVISFITIYPFSNIKKLDELSFSLETVEARKYSHEHHSYLNIYSSYTTQCHRHSSINIHHFMRVIFCYYSYMSISYPVSSVQPKEKECSMPSLSIQQCRVIHPYPHMSDCPALQMAQRYPSRCWPMPFP